LNEKSFPKKVKRALQPEDVVLLLGATGFILFLGLIFILVVLLPYKSSPIKSIAPLAISPVQPFSLPPTWTPRPTPEVIPTLRPTPVFTGRLAAHLYQSRPPAELMRIPLPPLFAFRGPLSQREVLDLARILQGESPGDKQAAYWVGWVAKNRHRHAGYGDTYYEVSSGFFGYRADTQPREEFIEIAKRIIRSGRDPTDGCLYALSRTDITNLGVPPERADKHIGEWFFFRTWPLG